MRDLQRYVLEGWDSGVYEDDEGKYVLYEDYNKALAGVAEENAQLRARCAELEKVETVACDLIYNTDPNTKASRLVEQKLRDTLAALGKTGAGEKKGQIASNLGMQPKEIKVMDISECEQIDAPQYWEIRALAAEERAKILEEALKLLKTIAYNLNFKTELSGNSGEGEDV